jgi:signal transduction histidine kinase
VAGPDGRVTALNRAARRMLGTTGDPHGRDYREVLPLVDSAGADWWSFVSPYRGIGNRTGHPERLLELRGSSREFLVTARYVRDRPGGPVQRLVVAFRDTRARRRADRDQADLVSTVAHEIRSPLTTVKGFTATVLAKWDRLTDDQKRTMLRAVEADADRVTRLLSDLLDVSRIDAGRLELRRKEFDLAAMAEGIVGRFELQHDGHKFQLSFPDGFPRVYADPDKIEQVLTNLVENAVKYSDGGAVTVTGQVTDTEVEVAVRDQGVGIPADQLPLIFTKFYRRAGHGSPSGTGLGLFIARGLVEAHDGRIWADSSPDQGSTLRFRLPRGGLELAGIT